MDLDLSDEMNPLWVCKQNKNVCHPVPLVNSPLITSKYPFTVRMTFSQLRIRQRNAWASSTWYYATPSALRGTSGLVFSKDLKPSQELQLSYKCLKDSYTQNACPTGSKGPGNMRRKRPFSSITYYVIGKYPAELRALIIMSSGEEKKRPKYISQIPYFLRGFHFCNCRFATKLPQHRKNDDIVLRPQQR